LLLKNINFMNNIFILCTQHNVKYFFSSSLLKAPWGVYCTSVHNQTSICVVSRTNMVIIFYVTRFCFLFINLLTSCTWYGKVLKEPWGVYCTLVHNQTSICVHCTQTIVVILFYVTRFCFYLYFCLLHVLDMENVLPW
jgi:hypothetical protein